MNTEDIPFDTLGCEMVYKGLTAAEKILEQTAKVLHQYDCETYLEIKDEKFHSLMRELRALCMTKFGS